MRRAQTLILVPILAVFSSSCPERRCLAESKTQAIRFGKLVDGTGKVWSGAIVVIQDGRIVSVGEADSAIPSDAQMIDLSRFTGIPGLIDVHTHMTFHWDGAPGTRPWQQLDERTTAVNVFLAQENARKTLESGVTTVRDLGLPSMRTSPCAT